MLDQLTVTDPRAAAAFASGRSRRILFALVAAEMSLQELHADIGISHSLLHYHVGKLVNLGLIRIVRKDPRRGRAITIYRAVANSFLVSGELTETSGGARLKAELEAALEQGRLRSPSPGTLYFLGGDCQPMMRRLASEDDPQPMGEWWWRLRLSKGDAAKLLTEIKELVATYRTRGNAADRGHLCHFALAEAPRVQHRAP